MVTDALLELRDLKAAMSLKGKMAALTDRARDFNTRTGKDLDDIAEKISAAEKKRDEAVVKHHAYYDEVSAGIEESIHVIDELSNGVPPLGEGGGK